MIPWDIHGIQGPWAHVADGGLGRTVDGWAADGQTGKWIAEGGQADGDTCEWPGDL